MSSNSPLLILVDGHSLAFRAYYAFGKSRSGGLQTAAGIPTSVCFGFLKSLLEVIQTYKPESVAIAFDRADPTFRHEADATYKADRAETPPDFIEDVENLKQLLEGFRVPILSVKGFEADDVLGTLAERGSAAGYQVKILSGDRDLFQLVDPQKQIAVLYLGHGKGSTPQEFTAEKVYEKLGITPEQVVDYKALCGDQSDNIPGVRGIGEKTAVKLLSQYGTLDKIYNSLDAIGGAIAKKLREGKTEAYHSQHMARIVVDVPLELDWEDCQLTGFDRDTIIPLLQRLEFQSFIDQINQIQHQFNGTVEVEKNIDISEPEDGDTWFFSAADTEKNNNPKIDNSIRPQIIKTPDTLETLIHRLQTHTDAQKPVAWDTETTALEPRDAKLVGIGCCWGTEPSDIAYIPLNHPTEETLPQDTVLDALRPILESETHPKTFQNTKFDRLIFRAQGIQLKGVVFDTMLASYVLNPEESHNLTDLSLRYVPDLGVAAKSYSQLVPKGKTIADLDIATVANYCGLDVYTTYHITQKLQDILKQFPKLDDLLRNVEQPLEPVLAEMEYTGIRIDSDYLNNLSKQLGKTLEELEKQAHADAGESFNLGSTKKLSELLFDKLGLDRKKSRKTKTGYSTDAKVLEKLQGDHPIIDKIIEYRTLSKLKSTYVDALPELVRSDTGRIHTDFNQAIASTGRLSSSNPNLQNIPIRTEFSRQIRKAFIPEAGWMLVSADYSQIELRILAHLSREPVLVEAYNTNQDVHTLTAKLLFERDEITSQERRLGKIINFGVIYGMGAQRFAREVGVSQSEGKLFIERFNKQYPGVFKYLESQKELALSQGYVETILGRRRYFEMLKGRDRDRLNYKDEQILRAAANAPIQGSSADIIKIAMIKLDEILKNYQSKLLLQVHDELVFEIPQSEWKELEIQIKSTMENARSLSVPLLVEIHAGDNWMEAK
ncbi:DNA polymerase I [Lyngbya sp. CCY1209]|uniref:DNA polymerase I n=1 Tax=Lyngbya sp. CCY1209 TaxID=2886103 RepID=UPI002D20F237|nr:DNA polymerase I [Lyngbya sp. CCY1209]MEB3884938.1 DNA polymerase I [Lyngbya sp. CCY1209]